MLPKLAMRSGAATVIRGRLHCVALAWLLLLFKRLSLFSDYVGLPLLLIFCSCSSSSLRARISPFVSEKVSLWLSLTCLISRRFLGLRDRCLYLGIGRWDVADGPDLACPENEVQSGVFEKVKPG